MTGKDVALPDDGRRVANNELDRRNELSRARSTRRPNPDSALLPRPDWIMVGVPVDRGVRLYASKELPRAEFEVAMDRWQATGFKLTAELRGMLVIDGATYGECILRLEEIWRNAEIRKLTDGR